MPRKPGLPIAMTVGSTIMACAFFADGQKYKGSFAVMVAVGFLLAALWPRLRARFRAGSPDA
jgi:hypothetical protein